MDVLIVVLEVGLLVAMSAVCSGLNVALMSLPISDLKRKAKLGDNRAKKVLPFRLNSHLTLASILFTNVAVISASSLVLDSHLNGFVAGGLSTLLIVVFGEVLPQAWFARYALRFCAKFTPFLKIIVVLSYPVAKPLQIALDKILGHENSLLHTRSELGMLISEHLSHVSSELDEDEVEIMRGALGLSKKRVKEITTPLANVYWLTPETLIDSVRVNELKAKSWSRIPIFNTEATICYGILLMKDLVDLDFDEEPVHVEDLPLHPTKVVGSMTALDTMFRKFITVKSHLMPVEKDDKIIGIVTIEDLLEEIVGHEIEDESDLARTSHIANQSR